MSKPALPPGERASPPRAHLPPTLEPILSKQCFGLVQSESQSRLTCDRDRHAVRSRRLLRAAAAASAPGTCKPSSRTKSHPPPEEPRYPSVTPRPSATAAS